MVDFKKKIIHILRWSEQYTKTDMVYVLKNGFWLAARKGASGLISIATLTAFANLLPIETYGTYQFIIAITGLTAILGLPGIQTALVRAIAQGKEGSLSVGFNIKFRWSLLGSCLLFALAGWYLVNQNFLLSGSFAFAALFLPLKTAFPVFLSFWHGKKRFDISTLLNTLTDLGIAITIVSALFLTDNLLWIVLVFFASTSMFYGIAYLYTQKKAQNHIVEKSLVTFGKNLTIMKGIEKVAEHLDKVILWTFLGPLQVAIYAFASLPVKRLKTVAPIQQLALPKLSEIPMNADKRKFGILRKSILIFAVTIPFALFLALIAPAAYALLFPQYMESVPFFQALLVIIALMPFSLLKASFLAEMKTKILYIIDISVPVMKIILFFVLAPLYGIWGIVWAIIIAEILRSLMTLYFFIKA